MRRQMNLAMAVLMVMAVLPLGVSALGADQFDDVEGSHVFSADIEWLAGAGITRGCNPPENSRFCPDDPVTRGQMAAFLVRGLDLASGTESFNDTSGHVFEGDISSLATAGITRGCNPPENSRFCPDDPVTRGQMAAFLVRGLDLASGTESFNDTSGHVFEGDISSLATAGITRGCNPPENSRFCPDDPVTRGQMAAFLHRALGGDIDPGPDPDDPEMGAVAQVSVSRTHSCAVDEAGALFCWGQGTNGRLGIGPGDGDDREVPTPVDHSAFDGPVAHVTVGPNHTCAVTEAGTAYCWGQNARGNAGVDGHHQFVPVAVEDTNLDGPVSAISAAGDHTCAVTEAGTAYCWGWNDRGQLGDGTEDPRHLASKVDDSAFDGPVVDISAGHAHACAVTEAGTAYCWGQGNSGQLGSSENGDQPIPVEVDSLATTEQISAGNSHTCAVSAAGTSHCWGDTESGKLGVDSYNPGTGQPGSIPIPEEVHELGQTQLISAGHLHTCAIDNDGDGYCWGRNNDGALGDGTTDSRHHPTPVDLDGPLVDLAVADGHGATTDATVHTCAVTGDGSLYCWGANNVGQLGDGTQSDRHVPRLIHAGG